MPDLARIPPARRPELLLSEVGDDGRYVAKDLRTGAYFQFDKEETFLLTRLDGRHTVEEVCRAFEEQFGQPLSPDDLQDFVDLALSHELLQRSNPSSAPSPLPSAQPAPAPLGGRAGRHLPKFLCWRKSFFDPDRLLSWLEPKARFLWTRPFFALSMLSILVAGLVLGSNWREALDFLPHALHWQTLVLAWLTLVIITFLHEFAHGLTCKHYGGEVHEVGFLLLFLMPGFYCNVSDAWLFREKSKRLWVTLAGGYCDLVLWSVAVFAWRLALPGTLPHYLAWVVFSVCGTRVLINFNPFLKLDGYYLFSDWTEVSNLHQRSWSLLMGHLRRVLWGGPRPEPQPRTRLLLGYGILSWLCSLMYLTAMIAALVGTAGHRWGLVGGAAAGSVGAFLVAGLFRGVSGGEVSKMIYSRWKRTIIWASLLASVSAVLYGVELEDRAGGPFQLRCPGRVELRAPVSGFLRAVYFDEGQAVSTSGAVALLEVPGLVSRIRQKHAEVREAQAKLRLLEVGPRPEEVAEQRERVERARTWRDLARQDLERGEESLRADLARLDGLLDQYQAELAYSQSARGRVTKLYKMNAVSAEHRDEKKKAHEVSRSLISQVQAQRRAVEATGARVLAAELARRAKELADAGASLALLEAGSRPEQIEAERAHLARLKEELAFLEAQQGKVQVFCPSSGQVATPHVKEKVGQFLKEGDLICTIEESATLDAEIQLPEQEAGRVRVGQPVTLKVRALPFETFTAEVSRIAAAATTEPSHEGAVRPAGSPLADGGTLTISCRLSGGGPVLRPGMTGHARIDCGRRAVGWILLERGLRHLRTEYWW